MNIMTNSVFNSILGPIDGRMSVVEKIEVEMVRVDQILGDLEKQYKIGNVFLKIDTQGLDLDVFESAFGCLDRIKGVQTEVSVYPIYKKKDADNR